MKNVFNKNLIVGIQKHCETQIANVREYEAKCGTPNSDVIMYHINNIIALCTIIQMCIPDSISDIMFKPFFIKDDFNTICDAYVDISYRIDNGYEGE